MLKSKLPAINERVCALCDEPVEQVKARYVEVYSQWGWHCPECIKWGQSNWKDDDGWPHYNQNFSVVGGNGTAGAKPYVYVPSCQHNLTPLRLPNGQIVYLSGSMSMKSKTQGPLPTAAVYFDDRWTSGQLFSNDGMITAKDDDISTLVVHWPDFNAIDQEALVQSVGWAQIKLAEADEVLEVGCMAGHGRTGSFAAALCVMQGLSAEAAILYVKAYYCTKAIESKAQREMLQLLDKEVNGCESASHGS